MIGNQKRDEIENLEDLDSEIIVYDIETTGFQASSIVTTITFRTDEGYISWVNTKGENFSGIDNSPVDLHLKVVESEEELLNNVLEFVNEYFDDSSVLVAYNGETWRGGFDNSFLRTRCVKNEIPFIFNGVRYHDLYSIFGKQGRFNTEVKSVRGMKKNQLKKLSEDMGIGHNGLNKDPLIERIESEGYDIQLLELWYKHNFDEAGPPTFEYTSLDEVYDVLIDKEIGIDPAEDSGEVVTMYHKGEFDKVLKHNISDVIKTSRLLEIAIKSVSKSDFNVKTL
jgi:uncharacterized protein YprB with RNaseH-like and TPR domain